MKKESLSFIVPFYFGEEFILKLLISIERSYLQSQKKIIPEIIIVIDSISTEINSLSEFIRNNELKTIPIKIYKNPENLGVARTRDIGAGYATGKFLTFIDQDDYIHSDYFTTIEKYLDKNKFLLVFNGYIQDIENNKEAPMYYYNPRISLKRMIKGNKILTPSFTIINREVVCDKKLFELPFEGYKGVDDWLFFFKILNKYSDKKIVYIKKKIVYYCIHSKNFSRDLDFILNGSIEVLKYFKQFAPKYSRLIDRKIMLLNFSKLFYKKRITAAIRNPLMFLIFMINYFSDGNRMVRFIHKKIKRM